jgi:transposase
MFPAGRAKRALSATPAAGLLARLQPATMVDTHRAQIAGQLLASVRRLDAELKANQAAIGKAVRASHTTLTRLHGVGVLLAAKIIAHTGQLHRFPDRGHYASYNGSAPIEASSGDRCRHRLNRGGNRQLNSALHIIAVCQIRDPGPGQANYQRKLAEGKTPAEARRALKRRISDAIYRCLHADHQGRNRAAA